MYAGPMADFIAAAVSFIMTYFQFKQIEKADYVKV